MVVFWAAMPCGLIGRYQLSEQHSPSVTPEDGDWSSEMLVPTYKSTRHRYLVHHGRHLFIPVRILYI
jgi:hypothetical protein